MHPLLKAKYGFLWVTLLFFLLSVAGHWIFAWFAYVDEHALHSAPVDPGGYVIEVMRDTLENWQSEFLQLMWQVAGLAYLLYLGSPQSKEGDERKEEKLDAILEAVNPAEATRILSMLEHKYPKG
jgi:hypothetical protein